MSRIKLVIADEDRFYIESLSKFIREFHPGRYEVTGFTQRNMLQDFLRFNNAGAVDILLSSPEVLPDNIKEFTVNTVILLMDAKIAAVADGYMGIFKYQPGDKILDSLLKLYSNKNPSTFLPLKGDRKTLLTSVFSPQGGSGKTVIAFNIAVQLAKQGLKVFYCNMETLVSCGLISGISDNKEGLSKLIYCMKDSKKNLSMQIDILVELNKEYGVFLLNPPDCSLDLDELNELDIEHFFTVLRGMGQFDAVIFDIDSSLNKRNLQILSMSDRVLLIMVQDMLAIYKLKQLEAELKKIAVDHVEDFYNKIIPLINKFNKEFNSYKVNFNGKTVSHKIPCLDDVILYKDDAWNLNPNCSMSLYLEPIISSIRNTGMLGFVSNETM